MVIMKIYNLKIIFSLRYLNLLSLTTHLAENTLRQSRWKTSNNDPGVQFLEWRYVYLLLKKVLVFIWWS